MIKNFKPRLYQESILNTASLKNTLVVLPTGLGKTNIFLMLTALRLSQYPKSKILLVGPTKPLIDQYFQAFEKHFQIDKEKMVIFTGATQPAKRIELWKNAQIIFSTPQSIENDIISKRIDISDVSLLGVDEAHRAVSNYSYVWVAKQYNSLAKYPRIMGLTASPGSDMEKITEVCKNLFIEEVEVRTENDSDVKPYVQETEIKWVEVELSSELKKIKVFLDKALKERLNRLKSWDIIKKPLQYVNKKDLLSLQTELHKEAVIQKTNYTLWQGISIVAEIIKLQHSLELLETQGITPLIEYFKKVKYAALTGKTKAVKNLVADVNFKTALILTEDLFQKEIQHPKLSKLKEIIKKEITTHQKIIVFTQYRNSGLKIKEDLNDLGIAAELFVGQMKKLKTGLSQKEQKLMLDRFRNNEFKVLVATSIAEEGLDIPKVDLVIFYEPIPSAIRHIQRRGRTGRLEKGKVIILMTKGTRDEGYRWSAHHKQKRMYSILEKIKNKIDSPLREIAQPKRLSDYVKDSILIFADQRERSSKVTRKLNEKGAEIKIEQLKAGDYLCSQKVAVEFKTVKDFVDSIVDGRLLEQIKKLKESYEKPLLILEGEEDIYSVRKVHPHAIQGMLATIAISYAIPIIKTKDADETASLLYIIAKREQENKGDYFSHHTNKQTLSLKEQQEYLVSSLPGIGPLLAKDLLKEFKTIKNLVNAEEPSLTKVDKIGKVKAKKVREILDSNYEK